MINDLDIILAMRGRILLTGQVPDTRFFGYNDTVPTSAPSPFVREQWEGGEERAFTNTTTRKKAVMTYWVEGTPGTGIRDLLELSYAISGCFVLLGDKANVAVADGLSGTTATVTATSMSATEQPGKVRITITLDIQHRPPR